jgi:hypothetical protein
MTKLISGLPQVSRRRYKNKAKQDTLLHDDLVTPPAAGDSSHRPHRPERKNSVGAAVPDLTVHGAYAKHKNKCDNPTKTLIRM